MEQKTVNEILDAGKQLAAIGLTEVRGIPASLIPPGYTLKLHDHLLAKPNRIKQNVIVYDAASFIDYFNQYSNEIMSAIFFDIESAKFTAIIDYHNHDDAEWCDHTVTFACKKTKEWQTWLASNGVKMDQMTFAYFIESNLDDIADPAGAQMLEIVTSLKANTKISFTSARRLNNGETQFEYAEEINGQAGAKGNLKIPEEFSLGLKLFDGGDHYKILARFRYRISDGKLHMWYDLVREHKAHEAAVNDTVALIRDNTNPMLFIQGSPAL